MQDTTPFTLSYGEGSVLAVALTIAINQLEQRLADDRMVILHAETEVQLRISKAMLSRLLRETGSYVEPEHVSYPHQPGYLMDCAACESRCHCEGTGNAECVYHADDNPHR